MIRIFTDGSCSKQGALGSWAYIINFPDGRRPFKNSGVIESTTSNRAEMLAVIQALRALMEPGDVEIVTDSEYVGKGLAFMVLHGEMRGTANADLWKDLYELTLAHNIFVTCVRGHCGIPDNEACDKMAEQARKKAAARLNANANCDFVGLVQVA